MKIVVSASFLFIVVGWLAAADGPAPARPGLTPLEPPSHLHGRLLTQEVQGSLGAAQSLANAGAGYEAARLLGRIALQSPEAEEGKAARRLLAEWGVEGIAFSDATQAEISARVRRSLEEDEEILGGSARVKILLELGEVGEAAKLVADFGSRRLRGSARTTYEILLAHYALKGEEIAAIAARPDAGEREKELTGLLERARRMARLHDLARFLTRVEPEAGRVLGSLLVKAYPEVLARRRDEGGPGGFPGGFPGFGGFGGGFGGGGGGRIFRGFAREQRGQFPMPFGGPPGGFGGPPGGFGGPPGGFGGGFGGGRGGGGPMEMIRGIEARIRAGNGNGAPPGPAPVDPEKAALEKLAASGPAAPAECLAAARLLAPRDREAAQDLLSLALLVHAASAEGGGLREYGGELHAAAEAENLARERDRAREAERDREEEGPEDSGSPGKARGRSAVARNIFGVKKVHTYELELAPEAVEALRKAPKEFVHGKFKCGERSFEDIGVRIKGSVGSYQPLEGENKPGFTFKFNRFTPGQKFHGLHKVILNNAAQSPAYLSEYITYGLFRDAGLPAPRVAYVDLKINGQPYGLYVQVEAIAGEFLERWFGGAEGDLYEGPGDVGNWGDLDLDSDPETADREKLRQLAEVAGAAAEGGSLQELGELVNLDRLARFLVLEALVNHWDGYRAPNNYRIYLDPLTDQFTLIPHGVDQTISSSPGGGQGDVFQSGNGVLCRAILASAEGKKIYRKALEEILTSVWDLPRLRARIAKGYRAILPSVQADPRQPYSASSVEDRVYRLLLAVAERRRVALWQLRAQDDPELARRMEGENGPGFPFQFGGDRGGRGGRGGGGDFFFGGGGPPGGVPGGPPAPPPPPEPPEPPAKGRG